MMSWPLRKTVLVPIDFSEHSFAALGTARELVDEPGHLHVIHVLPHLEPADPGMIWETVDSRSRTEHAEKALRKELDKRGCEAGEVEIRFGDPGHEIAQYAEQISAALIVVSSRGRSGLERLLIGSVADRVVRLAPCAVLVLKR